MTELREALERLVKSGSEAHRIGARDTILWNRFGDDLQSARAALDVEPGCGIKPPEEWANRFTPCIKSKGHKGVHVSLHEPTDTPVTFLLEEEVK